MDFGISPVNERKLLKEMQRGGHENEIEGLFCELYKCAVRVVKSQKMHLFKYLEIAIFFKWCIESDTKMYLFG